VRTPTTSGDDVRRRLLEAAARLLGEEGPSALTTRRLAREADTSTMAVYTHFGSMPALVREVVAEGFARLYARVGAVPVTDDPMADLTSMAIAYRENALTDPHRLHDDELDVGLEAFGQLVTATARAMDAGALRRDDPAAVAGQVWTALHGYVMLEMAGYHRVVEDPDDHILWPMLANLVASLAAPAT
jgi:AcrR family transcriptional regulator